MSPYSLHECEIAFLFGSVRPLPDRFAPGHHPPRCNHSPGNRIDLAPPLLVVGPEPIVGEPAGMDRRAKRSRRFELRCEVIALPDDPLLARHRASAVEHLADIGQSLDLGEIPLHWSASYHRVTRLGDYLFAVRNVKLLQVLQKTTAPGSQFPSSMEAELGADNLPLPQQTETGPAAPPRTRPFSSADGSLYGQFRPAMPHAFHAGHGCGDGADA